MMGCSRRWLAIVVLVAGLGGSHPARGAFVSLYDGQLNTRPGQQGWSFRYLPLIPGVGQTLGGGMVTVDTSIDFNIQAGYFTTDPLGLAPPHPDLPTLDRMIGYTIRFDVQIDTEDHGTRVDRAGFSLIVLGNDRKGIELGFWANEIWAQSDNPLFTHAEGSAFDTSGLTRYELAVLGSGYTLFAGGTPILNGALRDYSSFGLPYSTPNQIFLGDDTTSAGARFRIASVAVAPAVAPEPSSLALLGIGLVTFAVLRRPRGRS